MRLRVDDVANNSGLLLIQINLTHINSKENDHRFVLRTRPPIGKAKSHGDGQNS